MDGDNQFDNGVYDERRWSAPVIQSPEELAGYLRAANIPGRRLTGVRCVGPAYNFTREWLESLAFTAAMSRAYAKCTEFQGQVSGEHAIGHAKKRYLRESVGDTVFGLMASVKKVFDPDMILNPGKVCSDV